MEKLKALLLRQDSRRDAGPTGEVDTQAREELAKAQDNLKVNSDKSRVSASTTIYSHGQRYWHFCQIMHHFSQKIVAITNALVFTC